MISLLSNLIIYWDNLLVYVFWLLYAVLFWLIWSRGLEIYIWIMSEPFQEPFQVNEEEEKREEKRE